jgi:hypothetical protein
VSSACREIRDLHWLETAWRDLHYGFHVITFDVSFPRGTPAERICQGYAQILARLESEPGVVSATYAWPGVYDQGGWSSGVEAEGHPPRRAKTTRAGAISVGPAFFETLGPELLHGRSLGERDVAGAPAAAVINESLSRYLFGTTSPIGRYIKMAGNPRTRYEVVGLVRDARHYGVRAKTWRMICVPPW